MYPTRGFKIRFSLITWRAHYCTYWECTYHFSKIFNLKFQMFSYGKTKESKKPKKMAIVCWYNPVSLYFIYLSVYFISTIFIYFLLFFSQRQRPFRGYCIPKQKLACFVLYLKNCQHLLEKKLSLHLIVKCPRNSKIALEFK